MSSLCTSVLHRFEIVVYACQQHALVAERNAGVGEALERFFHFNRQLARMIHVHAHPERMMFLQHRAKLRRDSLRQENRNARADAKKLDVRNRAQAAKQLVELIVAENKCVAAAQEDVAHFGVLFEITERFLEIGVQFLFAHAARPRDCACNIGSNWRNDPSPETERGLDIDAPDPAPACANLRRTGQPCRSGDVHGSPRSAE